MHNQKDTKSTQNTSIKHQIQQKNQKINRLHNFFNQNQAAKPTLAHAQPKITQNPQNIFKKTPRFSYKEYTFHLKEADFTVERRRKP